MITYNKEVREEADTPLRQSQLVMLEMLKVVDEICKKHRLEYWLDAGTLLGAVRHNGFIPWDDDLDICMPRKDYEKFMEIAPKELPDGLFFQTKKTDKSLRWKWIKIRDNYSTFIQKTEEGRNIKYHQGIFIDVFPYDLIKDDFSVSKYILNRRFHRSKNPIVKNLSWFVDALCIPPVKLIGYNRLKRWFLKKHSSETPKYVSTGIEIALGFHTFETEIIFPLKRIWFENSMYLAPADSHRYLKQMFGDYMTLPPEENRKVHACQILPFNHCQHNAAKPY